MSGSEIQIREIAMCSQPFPLVTVKGSQDSVCDVQCARRAFTGLRAATAIQKGVCAIEFERPIRVRLQAVDRPVDPTTRSG
jgi:hypothetical protein